MPPVPPGFAVDRDSSLLTGNLGEAFPAIRSAWAFSQARLREISRLLAAGPLPPAVSAVALAGSLARMEASSESDCDAMVILHHEIPLTSPEAAQAYRAVWECLAPLRMETPNPVGIFAAPCTAAALLNPATVGQIDEPLTPFGLRFHLLLESQPVYGVDAYRTLLEAVVHRYAREYVALDPEKEWTYLLNDLIRYFRSLGIAYQWESIDGDHGNWRLRNVKFRHSRLVIYAGMLCLLGECSRERGDKVEWLTARLGLTPLERIAWVYAAEGDPGFERIAGCYDTFLTAIGDPEFRRGLHQPATADAAIAREANPSYLRLKQNSDVLVAELLRFILERRGTWSERFLEFLIL